MCSKCKDYFTIEYDAWLKSYEVQFNHFMGVFYFWIAVITFPATAGLISTQHGMAEDKFSLLLFFLGLLGIFLLAKMSDIRCSQLKYVRNLNKARYQLYIYAKKELPSEYNPPFTKEIDVRKTALHDFGLLMAITMSIINSVYIAYASYLRSTSMQLSIILGSITFLIGLAFYIGFVCIKLRPVKKKEENN